MDQAPEEGAGGDPARRRSEIAARVGDATRRLLGQRAERIYLIGGSMRDSVRVELSDRQVVLTRRRWPGRARLEAEALKNLHRLGAPVPAPLAFDGTWLAQEYVKGTRLSAALVRGAAEARQRAATAAIRSLAQIGRAGARGDWARIAPRLGASREWMMRVAQRPFDLSRRLGVAPPAAEVDALADRIAPIGDRFVKWDARPANAILTDEGVVKWIDWEHAGRRSGLEDFA